MELESIRPLRGPMSDYDFYMMSSAKAVLNYLKMQPDFRWWNRWLNRPKPLSEAAKEHTECNGHSTFLGWDSFTARNGNHEISMELYQEFRRVFGRPVTIRD